MKDLQPDQVIGNYRVIRRIGRGGMGSVYEVESLDLRERFALKTFTYDPKDDDGDVLKNKFLEEGKILARLRHPNIAHVYSLAFDREHQLLYFVMDLVLSEDGRPYSVENASFAELEEDTALAWFVDVCEALDYIHSQGIVHRDIKPGNLLVKPDGHVVLTDFGIAKVNSGKLREEVNPALTMRIDGNITVLGSNHYIAPEVDRGGEVTAAADAYSLGVMMFEMLTGKWYDRVKEPWALLDGRKYPWKRVLSMFLSADPADRPRGYAELAKRMRTWKGVDEPVGAGAVRKAAPPHKPQLTPSPERRQRKTPLLPVLLALGAVVAGLLLLKPSERRAEKPVAAPPPAPAVAAEPVAEAVSPAVAEPEAESVEKPTIEAPKMEPKPPEVKKPEPVEKPPEKASGAKQPAAEKKPKAEKPPKKKKPKQVDYGPIPQRSYGWFDDGKVASPRPVEFELANGERFWLQPYAPMKGYLMTDGWDMGTHAHLVEFTRPYWISRFCIEPRLLREFDAKGYAETLPIETAVAGRYPVYQRIGYRKILKFCEFLTGKYRSQLPPGYVFRLPTDAEWDRAIDSEGFKAAAKDAGIEDWREVTQYSNAKMREEFVRIREKCKLDQFGKWEKDPGESGYLVGRGVLIGGRSMATPNGVRDIAFGVQPLLDFLPKGKPLVYAESELDPVQGADDLDARDAAKANVLTRHWSQYRSLYDAGCSFAFHLAVGPDLLAERAWRKRVVSENPAAVPLPEARYDWNPKRIQSRLSRAKAIDMKLANGAVMTFCAVPKGRFSMSAVPGQDAKPHKVELDYAFWMSKYCVTAAQRRDYGKYDCEGPCRRVEKAFPDDPVYCAFNRREWDGYCRFLTERYRDRLPEGYVFRLPTEAEYEWAFVADEKTEAKSVTTLRSPGDRKNTERFAKRMKREGRTPVKGMDERGFLASDNVCLGGIAEPNAFGIHDLWLDGWTQWTYDLYEWDPLGRPDGCPEKNVFYQERERNPLHWDGRIARGGILRSGRDRRTLTTFDSRARAHIVLGPDLAAPLDKAELQPCPEADFGGRFVEGVRVHSLSSQQNPERWCAPERMATLLTRDPAQPGERNQAFLTESEPAPWVQLELPQKQNLSGAVIETLANRSRTAHLVFWISDDGKRWRELVKCERTLGRYRLDFRGKNAIRVKFVRIGRESGFAADNFSLHKVWLYGRK